MANPATTTTTTTSTTRVITFILIITFVVVSAVVLNEGPQNTKNFREKFIPGLHISGSGIFAGRDARSLEVEPDRGRLQTAEVRHSSEQCPKACICMVDKVDCSHRSLLKVPKLPTRGRVVNLSGNKIKNISCSSFADFNNIERLDLSKNPINFPPECTLKIPGPLKYFSMSSCGISLIPSNFLDDMKDLVELDLSHNVIYMISEGTFKNLGRLEFLDLTLNLIHQLNNDMFVHLKSLRFLSLKANCLWYNEDVFPPRTFNGLRNLETLYLHGNQPVASSAVVYPDKALAALPWLRTLWLDGYSNKALGPGFSALTNLTHLKLNQEMLPYQYYDTVEYSYCNMADPLPADFFANIKTNQPLYLNLSYCELSNIPADVFNYLPTLYSLDLSYNPGLGLEQFEVFSKGLENTTISTLNISYISDQSLQTMHSQSIYFGTFYYLKQTNLKVLRVDGNLIWRLYPISFYCLPDSVEHMTVNYNFLDIADINFPVSTVINLKTFNISEQNPRIAQYNFFENKSCASQKTWMIQLPQSLEILDATNSHGGPLPEVQVKGNTVLKRFYYSNNKARCISGPFRGVPSLEYLDLSQNSCSRLNPKAFEKLYSLRTLELSDNHVGETLTNDTAGVIFSDLISLEHLYLRNNVIRDLSPKSFTYNPRLQTLDLSNNYLWRFTPSLENVVNLRTLNLSYNSIDALSPELCNQLRRLTSNNTRLKLLISGNPFSCNCDTFHFLSLLIEHPEIFGDLNKFSCGDLNGRRLAYADLEKFMPILAKECIARDLFMPILIVFFTTLSGIVILAIYQHKRWQWTYLYYVGKSRLHIGSTLLTYKSTARVFFTFDQENLDCRRLVHTKFLPRLNEARISYMLGEVDFEAGPLIPSIAGAVVSTQKSLVLLSVGMFEDYFRALEVNLAIMHELTMRRPILVPVILLKRCRGFGADLELEFGPIPPYHPELYHGGDDYDDEGEYDDLQMDVLGHQNFEEGRPGNQRGERFDQEEQEIFQDLLDDFPPEISAYLIGQKHRCILYDGGSEEFWNCLIDALLSEE